MLESDNPFKNFLVVLVTANTTYTVNVVMGEWIFDAFNLLGAFKRTIDYEIKKVFVCEIFCSFEE